jgi:hypothetical protein
MNALGEVLREYIENDGSQEVFNEAVDELLQRNADLFHWQSAYEKLFQTNEEHIKRYEWDESVIKMLLRQIKIQADEITGMRTKLNDQWVPKFPSCELDDDSLWDETEE